MRDTAGTKGGARVPRGSTVEGLFAVPRLEELAADPSKIWVLDRHTTRILATIGITAASALLLREAEFAREYTSVGSEGKPDDKLSDWITVEEAANVLHRSPRWIFRNCGRRPFVRKINRKNWLISRSELRRWIDTRKP
jgi:Helix-turn-helix domain